MKLRTNSEFTDLAFGDAFYKNFPVYQMFRKFL